MAMLYTTIKPYINYTRDISSFCCVLATQVAVLAMSGDSDIGFPGGVSGALRYAPYEPLTLN